MNKSSLLELKVLIRKLQGVGALNDDVAQDLNRSVIKLAHGISTRNIKTIQKQISVIAQLILEA